MGEMGSRRQSFRSGVADNWRCGFVLPGTVLPPPESPCLQTRSWPRNSRRHLSCFGEEAEEGRISTAEHSEGQQRLVPSPFRSPPLPPVVGRQGRVVANADSDRRFATRVGEIAGGPRRVQVWVLRVPVQCIVTDSGDDTVPVLAQELFAAGVIENAPTTIEAANPGPQSSTAEESPQRGFRPWTFHPP